MADDLQTFREVTQSIKSTRLEMRLYVAGFVVALGVFGWGMNKGFDKLDALEASNARIEGMISTVVSDAQQIKQNTSVASASPIEPTVDSFVGWMGVKAEDASNVPPTLMQGELRDAWIYIPSQQQK